MLKKKKRTLEELEGLAKQYWEEKARQLVGAIAEREGTYTDELYPYLTDFYLGEWIEAEFKFPEHSLIKLSGYGRPDDDLHTKLKLIKGGLHGDYTWMVFVDDSQMSTPRFTGCESLGQALLLARWVYEKDIRALWT